MGLRVRVSGISLRHDALVNLECGWHLHMHAPGAGCGTMYRELRIRREWGAGSLRFAAQTGSRANRCPLSLGIVHLRVSRCSFPGWRGRGTGGCCLAETSHLRTAEHSAKIPQSGLQR